MYPRIIKADAEYRKAIEEVENLVSRDPNPGTIESERLNLLSLLIEVYESEKFPIEFPEPLEAIKFRMREQGLKQRDLIPFIGSKSRVSEVLSGKRALTVPMIRALHEGLGIPAQIFIRKHPRQDNRIKEIDWEKFPIKEIIKRGWVKVSSNDLKWEVESVLRSFFDPLGGLDFVPVLCRRTLVERSGKSMDRYALWAWTARILTKAKSMQLCSYNHEKISTHFLKEVAQLSVSEKGPIEARNYLAEHGIALVIEPHLPRTHLDGAAMLSTDGTPVIGLTIRHDRIDNFWFNLLHELAHIYKHLKSSDEAFIDNLDSTPGKDPREREADLLAAEVLIPRILWRRSNAYRQRSPEAIQELALSLNIHPAIIAGRIRHDAKNFYILGQMIGKGKVRKLFNDINWKKAI